MTQVAEVGEGDRIQVRVGDPLERLLDVTVRWVHVETTVGTVTLTGEITGEAPEWLLEQIRHPAPPARWWRRR